MDPGLMDFSDLVGLPQRIEERLRTGGAPARSLAFNGWGTLLAAGCADGSITLFDYQTRGVAAHLRGGHPPAAAIGALLWSADGRTLLSGGADGCLAGWDVGAGERRLSLQLPGGPITRLAWVPPLHGQVGDPRQQQPAGPTGHLALLPGEGEVLVGRGTGPAVLLSLRDPSRQQELPLLAAGSDGRSNDGAPPAGGQLAVCSRDGELIYAASRGVLLVLRRRDLALLDAAQIEGSPAVLGLELTPNGRRLMLTTADPHIRFYLLHRPGARQALRTDRRLAAAASAAAATGTAFAAAPGAAAAAGAEAEAAGAAAQGPQQWHAASLDQARSAAARRVQPHRNSLFYDDGSAWTTQQLDFVEREAGGRGLPWRCAALSPDGEFFAAARQEEAYAVQLWETEWEARQQAVLEGQGGDGVAALCWHPSLAPMQLLVVGAEGHIDVWAKAFTENWSAFAPDFKELHTNDEYIEPEDEFDANPRSHEAAQAAEAAARREVEAAAKAEPVDPGSQADQEAAVAEQLASRLGAPPGGCLPLLHLPQRLSPEGGATRDAAGAPAAGDAQEDAADAAAAAAPAAAAEMEEEEEQQEKEAAGAAADVRVPAKRQRSG
ncbi:retinoblastoma-binding 5-like protein [Micractinium conductrix]|uniref:Retinoblastoma-binding 5-like protein n=1 Tax=Micractinium conductrix TaxID=554055 RepID=A0A2P6VIM3_9CHLO|nr:retinoblastoma-binding 5-like protein [Micractinium conductrix]|eukprot:PSC73945.1 retinoblastoma-binding 5-like protein [Micractinium conductrix]